MRAGTWETKELITGQQTANQIHRTDGFADLGPTTDDRQITLRDAVRDQPFHLWPHHVAAMIRGEWVEGFAAVVGLQLQHHLGDVLVLVAAFQLQLLQHVSDVDVAAQTVAMLPNTPGDIPLEERHLPLKRTITDVVTGDFTRPPSP